MLVASREDLAETGGGHGQKGVDFQRHWALMRMFEAEGAGQQDFLFLFECFQDVAELDSATAPTSVRVYQVKKKDRGEWSWAELTGLSNPRRKKGAVATADRPAKFRASPLGKLCLTLSAFNELRVEGHFVSNAGCDLELANGGNLATAVGFTLQDLEPSRAKDLTEAISDLLSEAGAVSSSLLRVLRVPLPPDAPDRYLVGIAHDFLLARNPPHAGQARALVDALIAKLSSLGRRTNACATYEDLLRQRGYTREDFARDLEHLNEVPDAVALLEDWYAQLRDEGLPPTEMSRLRLACLSVSRRQLLRASSPSALEVDCDRWLDANPLTLPLRPWLNKALEDIRGLHPSAKAAEISATVLLVAVNKCADPISEG
jgi:hypothetical protein